MKFDRPRASFCAQAVLLVGLASCSGSISQSDDGSDEEEPDGAGGSPRAGKGGVSAGGAAGRPSGGGGDAGAGAPPEPPPPPATFECKASDQGGIPRRLWRLTPEQFRNSVAIFFTFRLKGTEPAKDRRRPAPDGMVIPLSAVGGSNRFSSYDTATMTDFEFRRAMESTAYLATKFVRESRSNGGNCYTNSATPVTKGCVGQTVRDRGPILFRRPLTDAEVAFYEALAKDNVAALGEEEAAALALQAMFMSPHFLYRAEIGSTEQNGVAHLTQHEIAGALALTLTDYPPDELLWKAAEAGELGTTAQIETHVARLLADPSNTGSIRRFVREYFRYGGVLDVFKDEREFRGHDAVTLYDETERFVQGVLETNGSKEFLKTMLTSTTGWVSYTNNKSSALYTYGIETVTKNQCDPCQVTFPPNQRAGILTQPSWLVGFSDATHNLPVQRGRFIAENLLCQHVPELPIGMVPPLPDAKTATMRERLAVHVADPSCLGCHKLMDHLGLAFESYDHVGRFRTTEVGKPIDASGTLADVGADGPFANAVELGQRLSRSPVVQQCFVRHVFRNLMGRQEVEGDGCALVGANDAYAAGGGDLVRLLASFFGSKSFLNRRTN